MYDPSPFATVDWSRVLSFRIRRAALAESYCIRTTVARYSLNTTISLVSDSDMSLERLLVDHKRWMKVALKEAERAYRAKEVPVGAVVVYQDQVVGRGSNMVEKLKDPTAHAEMIAITAACETLGRKHLDGCSLYVTLEPCTMCAGAIVLSRVDALIFAAQDAKAGAATSLYNIPQDHRLNHRVEIVQGVEESHASEILEAFFRDLREKRVNLPGSSPN